MQATAQYDLLRDGFAIYDKIYLPEEIEAIAALISHVSDDGSIKQSADIFAVRQFLKQYSAIIPLLFNQRVKDVLHALVGAGYFPVKSIYFNKPATSNWFVAYHQDLSVSVDKKLQLPGFCHWTVKQQQVKVQPPSALLECLLTIRIHLDDTTEGNGALRVIAGTHSKGIIPPSAIADHLTTETCCRVAAGGIMVMRPLLLHSSARTTNGLPRRVLHIEFANQELPAGLQWAERMSI